MSEVEASGVWVVSDRKLIEVGWNPGDESGDVTLYATGEADDVHNTAPVKNDGKAVLSYPFDFKGKSDIEVRTGDGTVLASGSFKVS